MTSSQQSDIRKMGNLRKLKTMKRKLFLLREESASGPARLEYYDSEKKYKTGHHPKRAITLKTCFNINKKSDSKHKHAIALYTKDDCFSVVCDNEAEQNEWLVAMLELQTDSEEEGAPPRPTFEHIWQVTVMPRGLCNGRTISSGQYRLCLTDKNLSLIRLNYDKPDLTFQLACIRRCGHTDNFFLMEVGRSAVTGAGELWMQVEDTVIAKNMHEAILSSMKSNTAAEQPPTTHPRPRSRSSASDHQRSKPITVPNSRGPSPGYEASTLPKRSKTISGEHPAHPSSPSRLRPGKSGSRPSTMAGISTYGRGHSPVANSPLSYTLESHRSRTDSMESRGSRGTSSSLSADEYDLSPMEHLSSGAASTRSVTPEGPVRESEYLSMIGTGKDMLVSPNVPSADLPCTEKEGYMQMSPSGGPGSLPVTPVSNDDGGYMDMSPSTPIADVQHYMDMSQTSFSSSPAVSTTSSHDPDDHAYLDMGHVGHLLPTVQERLPESTSGTPPADGGYLDMVPGHSALSAKHSSGTQLKPDEVYSYLADSPATEDFPKRAYSVGSKPISVKTNCKAVPGYVDMSEKSATLDKSNSKSCSAPHLVDKEKDRSHAHAIGSHSSSKKDVGDLFMELDFFNSKKDNGSFRPRTSSGGRDFRNRASSFGQEIRQRTGSFGKEGITRTQSIGRHDGHRPRVQTLGQESLRPRTSSFGPVDAMRPRSSSYGNSRYRIQNSRDSSRTSSQESLRKALGQRSSQESLKSNMSLDYMDMNPRLSTSPSQALAATFKAAERARNKALAARREDYMSMSPTTAESKGLSDAYMNMTSPPPSALSYSSQDSEHSDSSRGHSDHNHSLERKTSKTHRKSAGRPQPVVALRIPTPDSMKSSTESLSSSSQSSVTTRDDSGSETGTSNQKIIGDYIDISYSKKNSKGSVSKERMEVTSHNLVSKDRNSQKIIPKDKLDKTSPGSVPQDKSALRHQNEKTSSKVNKVPRCSSPKLESSRQEPDSYMLYSPASGLLEGPAPSPIPSLETVVSPIREENSLSRSELGVSPTSQHDGQKNVSPSGIVTASPGPALGTTCSSASQESSYMNIDFSSSKKESGKQDQSDKPEQHKQEVNPKKEKSASPGRSISPGRRAILGHGTNLGHNISSAHSAGPGYGKTSGRSASPTPPSLPAKPASAGSMLRDLKAKQEKLKAQTYKSQAAVEKVTPICAPFEPANGTPTASSVRQLAQANTNAEKQVTSRPRIPSPLGGVSVASSSTSGSSSSGGSLSPRIISSGPAGGRSRSASGGGVENINQPMTSRGSSCSLNSMEAVAGKGSRMVSRGSTGSLTAMDGTSRGSPRILLSECGSHDMMMGELVGVSGKQVSRQSSHSSLVGEKELNYASLDLGSSTDEMPQTLLDRGPKSPMSTKSRHSSADDNETPLNYAEIDFSKSEGLGPSSLREGRCSFELK